jgi:hypothetical protein
MEGTVGRTTTLARSSLLVQLLDQAIDEPSFVSYGQVVGLTVQKAAVVHQQEGRFEDQQLLIFRNQAKETRPRSASRPPQCDHTRGTSPLVA